MRKVQVMIMFFISLLFMLLKRWQLAFWSICLISSLFSITSAATIPITTVSVTTLATINQIQPPPRLSSHNDLALQVIMSPTQHDKHLATIGHHEYITWQNDPLGNVVTFHDLSIKCTELHCNICLAIPIMLVLFDHVPQYSPLLQGRQISEYWTFFTPELQPPILVT